MMIVIVMLDLGAEKLLNQFVSFIQSLSSLT
jgi:hypothetical protein